MPALAKIFDRFWKLPHPVDGFSSQRRGVGHQLAVRWIGRDVVERRDRLRTLAKGRVICHVSDFLTVQKYPPTVVLDRRKIVSPRSESRPGDRCLATR